MHSVEERGQPVAIAEQCGGSDLGREEIVSLLAQLPPATKKVLAMFYHENMRSVDIAACLGLTESEICKIQTQTVASIRLLLAK